MATPTDLRLNETERAALHSFRAVHGGSELRRHVRHALPEGFALVVRVTPPGRPVQVFTASARDISSSGMGFYNTAYIHVGTTCHVVMKTLKGEATGLQATVVRCAHVSGRIHNVGVVFEHEIDLGQFVQGGTVPVNRESTDTQSRVTALVRELNALVDQHAGMTELLARVAELAVLLEPFQPRETTPNALSQPAATPA